jgi:hypothetical protein
MSISAAVLEGGRRDLAALGDDRRRFIDDFGQMYAQYGISLTFGRVFALLLISDGALSLDDLATQLETSKSAISVATRDLARVGIARRVGRPGSRRVLYEACDDMLPIFEAQFARVRQSLVLLERGDGLALRGRARERLREMEALHEFWLTESAGIVDRWRHRRTG